MPRARGHGKEYHPRRNDASPFTEIVKYVFGFDRRADASVASARGEQIRDFVYVKDCVEVMWWFLQTPRARGIFNLGTGKARTWNDLVKAVFKASGVKPRIEYIDMPVEIRDQYQYVTEAKMDKLRKAGCPVRCRSLEDAITDYVKEHLQQSDPYL